MAAGNIEPMTREEAERAVEAALTDLNHAEEHEGALLTGWVVIAEWIDADGEPDLTVSAQSRMPWWRVEGLLNAAPDLVVIEYEDEDLD